MTEDGQRRSDAVLLQLFGREVIDFNLAELDHSVTRTDLTQKVFADIPWQCQSQVTPLGNQVCSSKLGVFNGIPAHYITLYFVDEQINALKVVYRERNHPQMLSQLRQLLGAPIVALPSETPTPAAQRIIEWRTDHGMVVLPQTLTEGEEAAMLWLASS